MKRLAVRPLRKVNSEPTTGAYRNLARLEGLVLPRLIHTDWAGADRIPKSGGVIIAPNHLSYMDPLMIEWFLIWAGRWPHFLAKEQLFAKGVIGWLARHTEQIPVRRGTSRAGDALVAAERALLDGQCVVIYPEGTCTRDPELWPMAGRSGIARLALATGVPVIPVAEWGAHELMPPPKAGRLRLFPRKTVRVRVGEAVQLTDLLPTAGARASMQACGEATDRIMDAITVLLGELRGETPPKTRFDMRLGRRPE